MCLNAAANARVFGNTAAQPSKILSGAVRSPHEFQVRAIPQLTGLSYFVLVLSRQSSVWFGRVECGRRSKFVCYNLCE